MAARRIRILEPNVSLCLMAVLKTYTHSTPCTLDWHRYHKYVYILHPLILRLCYLRLSSATVTLTLRIDYIVKEARHKFQERSGTGGSHLPYFTVP
ncbi:hypothetical protein BDR22DRAFT_860134 [Usnea florida]